MAGTSGFGRYRRLLLLTAGVVLVATAAAYRRELANVPRLRVGPLYTAIPAGDRVRLLVLGDTGTGQEDQLRVAQAMEARCQATGGIDAIILLGDNHYPSGVASVDDPQWHEKVEVPYGSPCLARAPIWAVLGNHDYRSNPAAQIEYTLVNRRWHMPNRFWTAQWGDLVRVIGVDTQLSEFCLRENFCTIDHLLAGARASDAVWTIAAGHHPLKAASALDQTHSGGTRGFFLRPLLCDRLDAWISGHAHHMEHRQLDGCRLELFVSGAGGAPLQATAPPADDTRFLAASHGFLELEADRARLVARFIDGGGSQVYESVRERGPRP